jgi:ribosome-associated heat shock protein Hsp15
LSRSTWRRRPDALGISRRTSHDEGATQAVLLPGSCQRIDKWLWHARLVRTRGDAAALVAAGFVRLNGKRVAAPGRKVVIDDVITLALDRSVRVLRVTDFCLRRGPSSAARALYRDLAADSRVRSGI